MLARGSLAGKLRRRIDRWVYLPTYYSLRSGERFHQVAKRHVPNNHEIDVAVVAQLLFGCRPEHECGDDPIAKRGKAVTQHVRQTGRFDEQRTELRKHR